MGTLAARVRAQLPARGGRRQLPEWLEGVAEALSRGEDGTIACAVAGRRLARDGADLGGALDGLRLAAVRATGRQPAYGAVRALATAWAEETLGYVHQLSCQDPVTGLAGPAHLRARLEEVHRGADLRGEQLGHTHALVVVDLPRTAATGRGAEARDGPEGASTSTLAEALGVLEVAERVRWVFAGDETLARVHPDRLAVLAARTEALGDQLRQLRELVEETVRGPARVWVERLPSSVDSVGPLLDELRRR